MRGTLRHPLMVKDRLDPGVSLVDALSSAGRSLRGRGGRFWLILAALVSGVLAFVPQFGLLNYYFSIAVAFVLGPGGLYFGYVAGRRITTGDRGPRITAPHGTAKALLAAVVLAVVPLVVITLNAVRVKNCDYGGGLLFYLMGPFAGALYAAVMGLFAGALSRDRRVARLFVAALVLAALVPPLLHLYRQPAIHLYHPVLGYFSGAIYDEVIEIRMPFVAYRLSNLVEALFVVVLVWLVAARRGKGGLTVQRHGSRFRVWAALLFLASAMGWIFPATLGYRFDRAAIQDQLGGVHTTENFVIHYAGGTPYERVLPRVARELERHHAELTAILGRTPDRRVRVFIYPDSETKRRLMGADRVYIVKPWLGELHLNRVDVGMSVIRHELVHAHAAACAPGLLGVPARYSVLPRMGIVEGLAVALEGRGGRLSLHEAAAAMRRLSIAPDMRRLLSTDGFWTAPARRAYVTAGSFFRFLVEEHGAGGLCQVYADGDFEAAFGASGETLIAAWEAMLDDPERVVLGDEDLQLAREAYDRPSVFARTCALEVAQLERAAARRTRARDFAGAATLLADVVAYDPATPGKRYALARALVHAGDLERARALFADLAEDERAHRVLRLRAEIGLGDIAWLSGDVATAAAVYRRLREAPMDRDLRRRLDLMAAVADRPGPREELLRRYLLAPLPEGVRGHLLQAHVDANPDDGLARYLLGRRRLLEGRTACAVRHLEGLARATLPAEVAHEAARNLAVAYFFEEEYGKAGVVFEELLALAAREGEREELREWLARVAWFR